MILADTQADFMRAIIANPHDNAPRLIFADWLDENAGAPNCQTCEGRGYGRCSRCSGEGCSMYSVMANGPCGADRCRACGGLGKIANNFAERAELIRLQIELKDRGRNLHHDYRDWCDCWYCSRTHRTLDLLTLYGRAWHQGTEPFWLMLNYVVSRGFIDHVKLTLQQFMLFGRIIAAKYPVTRWSITFQRPLLNTKGYAWYRKTRRKRNYSHVPETAKLPKTLFQLLGEPATSNHTRWLAYTTEADAIEALSTACFLWAREGFS